MSRNISLEFKKKLVKDQIEHKLHVLIWSHFPTSSKNGSIWSMELIMTALIHTLACLTVCLQLSDFIYSV